MQCADGGHFPGVAQSGESIQDVTARIAALNQVARQTGTVVNAVTEASQRLQGESERLEKAMARFRLPAQ